MKLELESSSVQDLIKQIQAIDIAVTAKRGQERQEQCETWSICRFIASMANEGLIEFPFRLSGRESPDFVIQLGQLTAGIEVTDACNEQYQHARHLTEDIPGAFLEPSSFTHGMLPSKKYRPPIGRPGQPLVGRGRQGNESDKEWIKYVADSIDKKSELLLKSHFTKFDEDWLLIYMNAPTGPIHLEYARKLFEDLMLQYWLRDVTFSKVAISSQDLIFLACPDYTNIIPIVKSLV